MRRRVPRANEPLRGVVAVAAAYALVLQTLVFAFGWCPYAALGQGLGFICSSHINAAPSQSQPAPADAQCPCCSMVCCDAVALATPKFDSSLAPPAFWTRAAPHLVIAWRTPSGSVAPVSPFGARAPPRPGVA